MPSTNLVVGCPGSCQTVMFPLSYGLAVLDAAAPAAVRAVVITFAPVTVETLAMISPNKDPRRLMGLCIDLLADLLESFDLLLAPQIFLVRKSCRNVTALVYHLD